SQYETGKIPLNLPAIIKLSKALNFEPREVSPRLAALIAGGSDAQQNAPEQPTIQEHAALYPIEVWSDETPLSPDEVELPFYNEVELSAGKGSEVMLQSGGRKLRFGRRTLQPKGVSPEAAACAAVTGNSMEPVLP